MSLAVVDDGKLSCLVRVEGHAGENVMVEVVLVLVVAAAVDAACFCFAMRIQLSMMLTLAFREDQKELSLLIDAFPLSRRDALEACLLG